MKIEKVNVFCLSIYVKAVIRILMLAVGLANPATIRFEFCPFSVFISIKRQSTNAT